MTAKQVGVAAAQPPPACGSSVPVSSGVALNVDHDVSSFRHIRLRASAPVAVGHVSAVRWARSSSDVTNLERSSVVYPFSA